MMTEKNSKLLNTSALIRWMRENLFSSVSSILLTIVTLLALYSLFRGIISFIISPERQWTAITYNIQLYMVQAYPEQDFFRIWFTVGFVIFMAGLTWGFNTTTLKTDLGKLSEKIIKVLLVVSLLILITPANVTTDNVLGTQEEVFNFSSRIYLLSYVFGLLVVFLIVRFKFSSRIVIKDIVSMVYLGLIVVSIWFIKLPTVVFDNSNTRIEDQFLPIASTTTVPWTVLYFLLIVSYFIGKYFSSKNKLIMKKVIPTTWLLLPLLVVTWIYRKPDFSLISIYSIDLPMLVLAIVLGYVSIFVLSKDRFKDYQRYYFYFSLLLFLLTFFLPVLRQLKIILFLYFLLVSVSPYISSSKENSKNLLIVWSLSIAIILFLMRGGSSETLIEVPGSSIYGGFALTWILAFFGVLLSSPFGVLLALGRTSKLPIIRIICTLIIELVRSVPFITWLFFGSVMLALFLPRGVEFDEVVRAIAVSAIFSSAYLAENVRGGLQSINKGQFEAADAVGLNTIQRTSLIVLPQALRAVIPTLVSQVISLFKDTSLVAIVGLFDLLFVGIKVIPNQSQGANFLGTVLENIVFCALLYWVFTYSFSRRSMKIEKRLGLGER
jgi:general L-amino acid transport system permease protein